MSNYAFVFPGQGSQSIGMLADLAQAHSAIKETFDQCSEALGYDLWALCQDGPEDRLNMTEYTQPALLAAGVAVWRSWQQAGGGQPSVMAGHSLGEYTALVCAGAMSLVDAVKLVALRGQLMQKAVPAGHGAMAAILGLEGQALTDVCDAAAQGQVVSPANLNAPGQVVIAGDADAVARAIAMATEAGAKRAIPLAVSAPSHCDLMLPAAQSLAEKLVEIELSVPNIAVVQNADAAVMENAEQIRDALKRQLYQPVRWTECVQNMASMGADTLVECGPGKVLTGLARRIDRSLKAVAIGEPAGFDALMGECNG